MNPEFDRYASTYEELLRDPIRDRFVQGAEFFVRRKWILLRQFLQRHAIPSSKWDWLDVGCGKGELLRAGAAHFSRVAGCDPSREMLQDSGSLDIHVQESPTTLPFPSASFDLITAVCVYHHVEPADRKPLTAEIVRVLRPRGVFCVMEHNPFNPATRLIVSRTPVDENAQLLTARSARACAAEAGLRPIRTEYFLYLPEKLYDSIAGMERLLTKVPLGGQYAVFAQK